MGVLCQNERVYDFSDFSFRANIYFASSISLIIITVNDCCRNCRNCFACSLSSNLRVMPWVSYYYPHFIEKGPGVQKQVCIAGLSGGVGIGTQAYFMSESFWVYVCGPDTKRAQGLKLWPGARWYPHLLPEEIRAMLNSKCLLALGASCL